MSNKSKFPGKENFERMNYLYQVCNLLATENRSSFIASVHYANLLINISKKTVQRLDINMKRTICKTCHTLQLPGITSKVRIKKKKVIHHCLLCSQRKVFDVRNRDYLPWTLKPESLVSDQT